MDRVVNSNDIKLVKIRFLQIVLPNINDLQIHGLVVAHKWKSSKVD